jgi:hypothetical protein
MSTITLIRLRVSVAKICGHMEEVVMQRIPMCLFCKEYIGDSDSSEDEQNKEEIRFFCNAFPDGDGIPDILRMVFADECAKGFHFEQA